MPSMNMSIRIFRALSTLFCSLKMEVSMSILYRMDGSLIPVAPEGSDGASPVFTGDLKTVLERVAYMMGVTINTR